MNYSNTNHFYFSAIDKHLTATHTSTLLNLWVDSSESFMCVYFIEEPSHSHDDLITFKSW